jgi:hypothetical protein
MRGLARRRPAAALVAVLLLVGWGVLAAGTASGWSGAPASHDTGATARAVDAGREIVAPALVGSRTPESRSAPLPLLPVLLAGGLAAGLRERAASGGPAAARRMLFRGGLASRAPPAPLRTNSPR